MPKRSFAEPPQWTADQLEGERRAAVADFVAARGAGPPDAYYERLSENQVGVRELFAETDDLRTLSSGVALTRNASLLYAARYLGGPPISADDLNTLVGTKVTGLKRLRSDLAARAAQAISSAVDRARFPWLYSSPVRAPTPEERELAIRWTAGLQAAQQVHTYWRTQASRRQQNAVRAALLEEGFLERSCRPIDRTGGLEPGTFCEREADVEGTKCDVPVALRDGRLLLIECKVSNSEVNSYKRLNHETLNKAGHWRRAFGERALIAAVLTGVFKLENLRAAQADGVALFWERNLSPLREFLAESV